MCRHFTPANWPILPYLDEMQSHSRPGRYSTRSDLSTYFTHAYFYLILFIYVSVSGTAVRGHKHTHTDTRDRTHSLTATLEYSKVNDADVIVSMQPLMYLFNNMTEVEYIG